MFILRNLEHEFLYLLQYRSYVIIASVGLRSFKNRVHLNCIHQVTLAENTIKNFHRRNSHLVLRSGPLETCLQRQAANINTIFQRENHIVNQLQPRRKNKMTILTTMKHKINNVSFTFYLISVIHDSC